MNKHRFLRLIGLGVLSTSAVIIAQQKIASVPPVSDAKPNFGSVVARPEGALPKVPAGFTVELYADNVNNGRMMEFASNGDLICFATFAERHHGSARYRQRRET